MKKMSIYSATLALLLGSLFYSEITLAKDKVRIYKICKAQSGQSLKLFKDPTKHSRILAKLPSNSSWITKQKGRKTYSHSRWQKVFWNNKSGWLKNSCLKLDKKRTEIVKEKPHCLKKKTRKKDCK